MLISGMNPYCTEFIVWFDINEFIISTPLETLLLLCWILWPVNITWTSKRGVQEAGLLISQYELILFRYEFMILIYYAISYCYFTM